jgi:hypothetical protein
MSAKRKRITDATLRALKPAPKGKRAEIFDAVVTDFGVRSTDKGIHSFIYYALRAVAMSARSRRIAAFVRPYLAELGRPLASSKRRASVESRDAFQQPRQGYMRSRCRAENGRATPSIATSEQLIHRFRSLHRDR